MQHVLIALQYDEDSSSYTILINCNICNFSLGMPAPLGACGRRPVRRPMHAPISRLTSGTALKTLNIYSVLQLKVI